MKDMSDIAAVMADIGARAKAAARDLAFAPPEAKTLALNTAADALIKNEAEILAANAKDLEYGREKGLTAALMDRLTLTSDRIEAMAAGTSAMSTSARSSGCCRACRLRSSTSVWSAPRSSTSVTSTLMF